MANYKGAETCLESYKGAETDLENYKGAETDFENYMSAETDLENCKGFEQIWKTVTILVLIQTWKTTRALRQT